MQSSSTSVYPQPSNTEIDSSITKEHFKTKTAEQICRFLGVTCRNEIVQLDGLRHKIKMMKRAKNDLTRTSMGRQHDRTLQFLMTKICDECQRIERLPTVSSVDEDRMNAGKKLYSELALQISAT